MIQATFLGDKIISKSQEAFALFEKSCFGEKKKQAIEYTPIEALFLLTEEKLQLFKGKKLITAEQLLKKIKRYDKKIEIKFAVYQDLRKRGYIPKTALKFGAEFRVYDKGIKPGEDHARWILYTSREHEPLSWYDFSAKNRVAHSTQKHLLIAIVDEEGDVNYYECQWMRP